MKELRCQAGTTNREQILREAKISANRIIFSFSSLLVSDEDILEQNLLYSLEESLEVLFDQNNGVPIVANDSLDPRDAVEFLNKAKQTLPIANIKTTLHELGPAIQTSLYAQYRISDFATTSQMTDQYLRKLGLKRFSLSDPASDALGEMATQLFFVDNKKALLEILYNLQKALTFSDSESSASFTENTNKITIDIARDILLSSLPYTLYHILSYAKEAELTIDNLPECVKTELEQIKSLRHISPWIDFLLEAFELDDNLHIPDLGLIDYIYQGFYVDPGLIVGACRNQDDSLELYKKHIIDYPYAYGYESLDIYSAVLFIKTLLFVSHKLLELRKESAGPDSLGYLDLLSVSASEFEKSLQESPKNYQDIEALLSVLSHGFIEFANKTNTQDKRFIYFSLQRAENTLEEILNYVYQTRRKRATTIGILKRYIMIIKDRYNPQRTYIIN